jgi:hypothetical protein
MARTRFTARVETSGTSTRVTIEMATDEFDRLMSVLRDEKAMAPVCAVVDRSPLGNALVGTTYCASTGSLPKCHQFSAKNWASAMSKAMIYCRGGNFSLSRGKCSSGCNSITKH